MVSLFSIPTLYVPPDIADTLLSLTSSQRLAPGIVILIFDFDVRQPQNPHASMRRRVGSNMLTIGREPGFCCRLQIRQPVPLPHAVRLTVKSDKILSALGIWNPEVQKNGRKLSQ